MDYSEARNSYFLQLKKMDVICLEFRTYHNFKSQSILFWV